MDPEVAAVEASSLSLEKMQVLLKKFPILLMLPSYGWNQEQAVDKFAALSWNGLVTQSVNNQDYDTFLRMMIVAILDGYYSLQKPDIDYKEKRFFYLYFNYRKYFYPHG